MLRVAVQVHYFSFYGIVTCYNGYFSQKLSEPNWMSYSDVFVCVYAMKTLRLNAKWALVSYQIRHFLTSINVKHPILKWNGNIDAHEDFFSLSLRLWSIVCFGVCVCLWLGWLCAQQCSLQLRNGTIILMDYEKRVTQFNCLFVFIESFNWKCLH